MQSQKCQENLSRKIFKLSNFYKYLCLHETDSSKLNIYEGRPRGIRTPKVERGCSTGDPSTSTTKIGSALNICYGVGNFEPFIVVSYYLETSQALILRNFELGMDFI